MERFNNTRSITIVILSSLLIFFTSLNSFDLSATEEDLEVRIEHKEQELSGVSTRIEILERYIKFEKGWEKKLKTGLDKINTIQDANSKLGKTFRLLASALSKGASEKVIEQKIADVNSKIEPSFRVDKKGGLYFGTALQMAGIQPQFAPAGIQAMTPETAKSVLTDMLSNNKEHLTRNENELQELRSREEGLLTDLESLRQERGERKEAEAREEQGELNALKGRLKSLEKLIEDRAKIAAQYNDKEFEIQLHIIAAKKALVKYREAMTTLGLFRWEMSSSESVRESIAEVSKTASQLRDAYAEYNKALDGSSDTADTVCAYASGLDSDPPPSPGQVSRWSEESKTILDKAVLSTTQNKGNVALLKNTLVSSVAGLQSKLSPLERILDNRDTYLDLYTRLGEIRRNLKDVKKDIQRAKELEKELKALIMTSSLIPIANIDEQLGAVKRDADALSQRADSGQEQELALIKKRIETADKRLGQTQMPDAPPPVPDLAPEAQRYLSKFGEADFSKVGKAKIIEAESLVADGESALSEAGEALATPVSDENLAASSLQRARQCYTTLTEAERQVDSGDTLEGKVGELETRLDKAEQEFDSLMEYNGEINGLIEKMKEHIARAETLKGLRKEIMTEFTSSDKLTTTGVKFKDTHELIKSIESHIEKLKKAYVMLDRASEEASEMRDDICEYAEKAGSPPFPSHEEIETWKAESKDRIFEVGVILKIAANEVDAQTGEIKSKTPGLNSKMELLEKARSMLLTYIKIQSDLKTFTTDINKEIAEAEKLKQSIDKYKEFGKRLKVLSKEIYEIDRKAKSLLTLVKSKQLELRVSGLINRIETMSKRFNNMPLVRIPDIPQLERDSLRVGPDAMIKFLVNKLAEIDSLLSRGKQTLSDADAVGLAGTSLQAIQNAPEAFEKANECHSSLSDAAKREHYIVRVSGKGYIPHFSSGSFIKEGFKDIKVKVDPDSGITIESELNRIRGEWNKPPNCERNIIDRLALSEGPPRFWTEAPEVTRRVGPLSAPEMDKQSIGEEWKRLGDDGPPFCELLETFCGQSCVGSDGPSAEGPGQSPAEGGTTPVNPDALDPDAEPEVAGAIQEWLSIAEPPENAVPGNRFYYDRFGRMMGSGGGMRTVSSHDTVDYGTGATPEAKVWSGLRKDLDSVNHCTLEEYVVARLEGRSTAHCRGRYTSVKPLKGKNLKDAKDEVSKVGLKYEVATGSAADSSESEGTVEKQEPGPDNHLKRGQTLKLVVHGPYVPPAVAVPRVTNMKFDDAVAVLERKGFEFERAEIPNTLSEEKNFTVKTQEPAADKKAEKGSTVKLETYGRYSYFNDALGALEACNIEKAKEYVAKMPPGQKKVEIEKKYKELDQHVSEIASGKDEAEKQFGNECYAEVLGTLNELLGNARCPDEREVIAGLISEYENKSKTKRGEMKTLTDKARREYDDECFDEALGVLDQALSGTRCEESRRQINNLVEKVRADKDKKAASINSMTGKAMTHFERGCYSDALNVMNKVINDIRCPASRKKAEKLISKIETKRAALSKRMDIALERFEQGCFEDAATVLNGLKEEIKCETLVAKINKLIEKVEARRSQLNRNMREASSKYESGCYEEAESILQGVAAEVRCEKYRAKIEGLLAKSKKRKAVIQSDMNNAMNKYEAGDYQGAKNILQGVLNKPLCGPQRTKVEGLIAKMKPVRESPLMPDLTGMHVDDAANTVRNLGMVPSVRKDKTPNNRNDEYRVYAQNPSTNTPVNPGSTVEIYAYSEIATPIATPEPIIQPRNEPFYIAFRMYFPDIQGKSEFPEGSDYDQYLRNFNTSNITYKSNEDANLIMHISGDALRVYDKSAFVPGKKYSQEIRMTVLSEEIKKVLNKHTIDGAFLLEVASVFGNVNELKGSYPKAGTEEQPVMEISNSQGTYTYHQESEAGSGKIWGGRLVEGWPARMKQKNLELVKILFNFCFIATVVYQDWNAPELDTLRFYRDTVLARSEAGKRVIRAYYKYGPLLALKVYKYERVRPLLRVLFDGSVRIIGNVTEDPNNHPYAEFAMNTAVDLIDKLAVFLDEDDFAAGIEREFIFFKWLPAAKSPEE